MESFFLRLESWIDRRAVRRIWQIVRDDPDLAETVRHDDTNIYRVPQDRRIDVEITVDDTDSRYSFRRSMFEALGFGRRVYIMDSQPGALFSKETRVVVLNGWWLRTAFLAAAPAGIEINREPLPLLDLTRMAPMIVHASALTLDLALALDPTWRRDGTVVTEPVGPPFEGPSPEEDVTGPLTGGDDDDDDGDDPSDTPPPETFGEEINALPPTYLFYGICFQGLAKRDRFGIRSDPLWDQTLEITAAFRRRGYRTRTGLAGSHGPSTPPVDTFNMMMLSLERDIPRTYCNSTKDQLVLYVAAHGYGAKYNPTPSVAMKYQTVSGRTTEWITHAAFWQRLQQIGAIQRNPAKVRVIVFSCRSGGLFGARPAALRNVGLFTSTADANTLCYASFFSCLRDAIRNPRVRTWTQLYRELARCLRAVRGPRPRNG